MEKVAVEKFKYWSLKNFQPILFPSTLINEYNNCEIAKGILDILNVLDDYSSAGRLRETYCIKLFILKKSIQIIRIWSIYGHCSIAPFYNLHWTWMWQSTLNFDCF